MRSALILFVVCSLGAAQPDLEKEDVRAIRLALQRRDPSLESVRLRAKKHVPATPDSIALVEAAPTGSQAGNSKFWVVVVSGPENRVRLVLDSWAQRDQPSNPVVEAFSEGAAYVHLYSDYGFYDASIKYLYDLSSKAPVRKLRYGVLSLTSSTHDRATLRYTASLRRELHQRLAEFHAVITIEPRPGNGLPRFEIVDCAPHEGVETEPSPLRAATGESVIVANQTPPGQPHRPSSIVLIDQSGGKRSFPAPLPTMEFYRKILPRRQPPIELSSDIGPFVLDGTKLWFATTFYDGEGAVHQADPKLVV